MESEPIFLMICVLFVFVVSSAFFAMTEVAFVSLSKLRLKYLLKQNKKNAKIVQRVAVKMDELITTILISNNFVNIAMSAIGTAIFIYYFGNNFWVVSFATIVITLIVLIFGEITPKVFAVKHAEMVCLQSAWILDSLIRILAPIAKIFLKISNSILKVLGETQYKRSPLITEEEIRLMIELGKEEGVLTDVERRMLHRIFEFGDTYVYQVMMPVEKMAAIDINASTHDLLNLITERGHSRIPVYEGSIDNIKGVIYARELLNIWKDKELVVMRDLLHPVYFINQRKRVSELLREFQKIRVYLAIVRDEFHQTIGLVTLEDLIEEIVGEIEGDVS
ncbi:MAG: hemolysin [Candidatus Omnitrophota bacterium]|nr:MAG: hemolysin [Candidatus Omnitrophota bacterium]